MASQSNKELEQRIALLEQQLREKDERLSLMKSDFDSDGKPTHSLGTVVDITERLQIENELKEDWGKVHEKESVIQGITSNFETFFDSIDDFLFVLDEQGGIIHCNKTVITRLGYTLDELKGVSVLNVHPEARRSEAFQIVTEMLEGKRDFCPIPLVTKEGKEIAVETRIAHGVWGGKPAFFGVSKDISRLKLSEEKFATAFYLNPSACSMSEAESGKYIEVNEAFYQLLGYTKEETIGRTAAELQIMPEKVRAEVLSKADSNGRVFNVEAELTTKNGEIKRVLLSGQNILIQDHAYRYTVVHDVSEIHKAKEIIEESERKFRNLYESLSLAYLIIKDGVCIDCNEAAIAIYGAKEKDGVVGKSPIDYSPEFQPNQRRSSEEAQRHFNIANEQGFHTFEWLAMRANKEVFYCEVSLKKFYHKDQLYFQSLTNDITERKRVESELIAERDRAGQNERKFRQLADNLNDVVWYRADNRLVYINPAFEKVYGIPVDDFYKDQRLLMKAIHPDDVQKYQDVLHSEEFLTNGNFYCEYRIIKSDNDIRWIISKSYPVIDNQGEKTTQRVGLAMDITDLKRIELELIEAREKAEESDRLKTAFLQNMSHEIRTPLNAICGFSSFLEDDDTTKDERKKYVQIIQNNSNQLLAIVTDVLTVSSLETKQVQINYSKVCVNHVFDELLTVFNQQISNQVISIFTQKSLSDQQSTIYTDKTKFTQIVSNLLTNALKFTNQGRVELGYQLIHDQIEFFVKDSGIGIKPELHQKIFERFRQADKKIQINYGGSGLGLSICKGFVELLGGRIWVESELGKGATFYFTLPYLPVDTTEITTVINDTPQGA